jgi:hypothetical protein
LAFTGRDAHTAAVALGQIYLTGSINHGISTEVAALNARTAADAVIFVNGDYIWPGVHHRSRCLMRPKGEAYLTFTVADSIGPAA